VETAPSSGSWRRWAYRPFLLALALLLAAPLFSPVLHVGAQLPERASGQLAFFFHRGSAPGIATLDLDSGAVTLLAAASPDDVRHGLDPVPVWSPDGSQVAFVCYRGDFAEVCLAQAANPGFRYLTNNADLARQGIQGADIYNLSWSPDGQRIAFDRQLSPARPPQDDILVVDLDGQTWNLSADVPRHRDSQPSWSADGQLIAFRFFNDLTGLHEIYMMNADGSGRQGAVSPESEEDYGLPLWSPHGGQLAFLSAYLYVIPRLGAAPLNLTEVAQRQDELSVFARKRLCWSPNSRYLAMVVGAGEQKELYVLNADGSGVRIMTREPGYYSYPTWSADSLWLAYEKSSTIWVVSARGGEPYPAGEGRAPAWRPVLPPTPTFTPPPAATPMPTATPTPAPPGPGTPAPTATPDLDEALGRMADISLLVGAAAVMGALGGLLALAVIYYLRRRGQ
jgi:dipeptidyl aminopeptidase/acylaminoacyl peptidase